MNIYPAGNIVAFVAVFTDENGNPINPGTVAFKYKVTFNTVTAPTVTLTYTAATTPAPNVIARTATGVYEAQLDTTTLPGYLTYGWVSTGSGGAAEPGSILVQPAAL